MSCRGRKPRKATHFKLYETYQEARDDRFTRQARL
jgi:hypothetical protein